MKQEILIIIALIVGFLTLASFMFGYNRGVTYTKQQALKNKVATYISDEDGNPKFIWLSNTNLNMK